MTGFAARFARLGAARSPLCLGLDPSAELLAAWGLNDDAEGLKRFCGTVLEAAGDSLAVVKPQSGFFERLGPAGLAELAAAARAIRDRGALCLIDAKRGDVASTMEGYAHAVFGEGGFDADAVTVNAYLGFAALRPIFDRAAAQGGAVFVVVHSSNPEARALQSARRADGRTVAEALADGVAAFNAALGGGVGPVGAVVGATINEADADLIGRLPNALILAPGVGVQGASLAGVAARFAPAAGRVLPSVSRAILRAGPSVGGLREAMARHREAAWACAGRPPRRF